MYFHCFFYWKILLLKYKNYLIFWNLLTYIQICYYTCAYRQEHYFAFRASACSFVFLSPRFFYMSFSFDTLDIFCFISTFSDIKVQLKRVLLKRGKRHFFVFLVIAKFLFLANFWKWPKCFLALQNWKLPAYWLALEKKWIPLFYAASHADSTEAITFVTQIINQKSSTLLVFEVFAVCWKIHFCDFLKSCTIWNAETTIG